MSPVAARKRCFLIEKDIKVRSYDIDSAGHVSNIVYLRWMEDLRWELFERHFPLDSLIAQGFVPVISSTQIEYLKPIRLLDRPRGRMWIESITNVRLQFEGEVELNGMLATHATHTGVFVDAETMKLRRLPEEFVGQFKAAQEVKLDQQTDI